MLVGKQSRASDLEVESRHVLFDHEEEEMLEVHLSRLLSNTTAGFPAVLRNQLVSTQGSTQGYLFRGPKVFPAVHEYCRFLVNMNPILERKALEHRIVSTKLLQNEK